MAETDNSLKLRILRITTGRRDARMMNGGISSGTDVAFERYIEEYRNIRQSIGKIAELTATEKGAVLRYRDPKALPQRVLLNGQDPLYGSVSGMEYEILYIAIRQEPRLRIYGSRGRLRADAYIRTPSKLTEASGKLFHARVIADFGAPMSFTWLRNDEFFWGEYPIVFPFSIAENPPFKLRSPTLICQSWNESRSPTCDLSHVSRMK